MTIEFWIDNPYILIDKTYLSDIWPSDDMNYTQKMNAISRLVLVLTILGFISLRSIPILTTGIVTLGIICYMFYKCSKFNNDIRKWNIEKVTNFKGMFKRINPEFINNYELSKRVR